MSADPWSHEADMSGPQWEHAATRRRVGDTVTYTLRRHEQGWRACNDEPLRPARGLLVACALALLCWLVFGALGWWAIETFVGVQ